MAFPMILFLAIRETSLLMNMNGCMVDMFKSDNTRIVFEMKFGYAFFVWAQEAGCDDGSSFRAPMNDDYFMIGQHLAIVQGFLLLACRFERVYVSLRILAIAV